MKNLFAFVCLFLAAGRAGAQTSNLVVFSEAGLPFNLLINGVRQSDVPQSNIKVTGLTPNVGYKGLVVFQDNSIPNVNMNLYFDPDVEVRINVKRNKKGKYVAQYLGAVAINQNAEPNQYVTVYGSGTGTGGNTTTTTTTTTTVQETTTTSNPNTVTTTANTNTGGFNANVQVTESNSTTTTATNTNTTANTNVNVDANVGINTSVNVTETTTGGGNTESVNVNMNVGGFNVNISATGTLNGGDGSGWTETNTTHTNTNVHTDGGWTDGGNTNVNVNTNTNGGWTDGGNTNVNVNTNTNGGWTDGGNTNNTTTTTTTTTHTTTTHNNTTNTNTAGGFVGQGCTPVQDADLIYLKAAVSNESFSDEQVKQAKRISQTKCLTAMQIKEIMSAITFEDAKIEYAIFAHRYCSDPQNYIIVKEGLTFSSSKDKLGKALNL